MHLSTHKSSAALLLYSRLVSAHATTKYTSFSSTCQWLVLLCFLCVSACRVLATARLQNQRATSLNNVLSEARSAFRLLFGRCFAFCQVRTSADGLIWMHCQYGHRTASSAFHHWLTSLKCFQPHACNPKVPPHAPRSNCRGAQSHHVLSRTHVCHPLLALPLVVGITDAASTVKVDGETLRICLQSPVPYGVVTDFSEALQACGSLTRKPQGVNWVFELFQLHLLFGWEVLLRQFRSLTVWCGFTT